VAAVATEHQQTPLLLDCQVVRVAAVVMCLAQAVREHLVKDLVAVLALRMELHILDQAAEAVQVLLELQPLRQ
jgi:hypothetical protein